MKTFGLVLLFIILLVFLIFLDVYFGRKSQLKTYKSSLYPRRYSDIEVFTDGPELFRRLIEDLEQAKRHIHLLFYIVRNDDFSKKIISLLEKKASEGVEVRLLLDRIGSLGFSKKLRRALTSKGIHVAFSDRATFPFFLYKLQCRNHRKIATIDGKIGYLGGFNVGKEYVNGHHKLTPWRDCHVRFVGEGVHDLQEQFLFDWQAATKEKKLIQNYTTPGKAGEIEHYFYSSNGSGLEEKLCALIRESQKEILIGTPYFIPGKRIYQELVSAIKRNVKVSIVVPDLPDHFLVKEGAFRYFRELLTLGAIVYQYDKGFYHAKMLLIDDKIGSIGTANFDKRSFYLNKEMVCFFTGKKAIQKIKNNFTDDISYSHPISLEKLNEPNLKRSILEWLAALISPLL